MLQSSALESLLWRVRFEVDYSVRTCLGSSWTYELYSPFSRIYACDAAGAGFVWEGRSYSLAPDRLYLIPAWVRIRTWITRPVQQDFIHFSMAGFPVPLMQQLFPSPLELRPDKHVCACVHLWRQALGRAGNDRLAGMHEAYALIHALLPSVWAEAMDKAPEPLHLPMQWERLQPAVEALTTQLAHPPDNAALARRCNLSEDHFIRLFRQSLGSTPAEYGRDHRLGCAAKALMAGDESIEAIAERFGFSDRFHFSRAFRRRFGLGPAAYRRLDRR